MRACGNCGGDVEGGDAFCGQCGAELPQAVPEPERVPEPPSGPVAVRITNRSAYERGVEHLDPLGSAYLGAALQQAIAYSLFAALATIVLFVFGQVIGADMNGLIGIVWGLSFLVYLFTRIPVSLSEWKTLIEDKGPQAQGVFGDVAHTLRRRQVPADSIKVRQLSQPGHERRDYLEVRHGILTGYVTCFPYGTDLYIGWTLWWRYSPLHFAVMVVGRRWQVLTGRGTELHLLYRYDIAKAMREAMHAATGEAVDAARGLRRLEPLPDDVPVEQVVTPTQFLQPAVVPRSGL